jgi:hypothetical protein
VEACRKMSGSCHQPRLLHRYAAYNAQERHLNCVRMGAQGRPEPGIYPWVPWRLENGQVSICSLAYVQPNASCSIYLF